MCICLYEIVNFTTFKLKQMCFFYGSIFDHPHNYYDIPKDLFIYLFCHSHKDFFDLIFKCISGSDIVC